MKRRLLIALAVVAGIVIYAYGFAVTQVNLEELDSASRQESLTRIMRALAHPDFFEFDEEQVVVNTPVYVPCPPGGVPPYTPDTSVPYMTVTPPCGDGRTDVTVTGYGFAPDSNGVLNFVPPSAVLLQLGRFTTDSGGYFQTTVRLRDRESPDAQAIRAVTRRPIGDLHLSPNGVATLRMIVETVFMALLATTVGTILAIPVSFLAARNLMAMVRSPVVSVALSIIVAPIGILLGVGVARTLGAVAFVAAGNLVFQVLGMLLLALVAWLGFRWAVPNREVTPPGRGLRLARNAVLLAVALLALLAAYLLAYFAVIIGLWLASVLGDFAFLGDFLANMGGILLLCLPPTAALIAAGVLVSAGSRLGHRLAERYPPRTMKIVNLVLSALAGAVLGLLVGLVIEWLYQLHRPYVTFFWPALIGAAIGVTIATRAPSNALLPLGLAVYSVTRTILNALRAVEALIMVIIFAVWVGIGPFAGVLALGLHTVAALAKLYSEQVESIATGPLEAVLATGASRLQMVVYAVIPQIVSPYISFTMYRWDINVRMSTIIGFAGGGGIGFLLQQNINLLNYRAASAQIIAIAVVVALMDYLSSAMRQRTL